MKTYYDQRRTYFHNIRFSGVEEERLQERRKKFRFESVSDFIHAAVLDDQIKVVTEVHQDPIRKDYTELIKSTVECIRTLDFRMTSKKQSNAPVSTQSSSKRKPTGSASSRLP